MEEFDESTDYSAMFDDDILLQKTDWDCLFRNKVKFDSWKESHHNGIKTHVGEAKGNMLEQLEKRDVHHQINGGQHFGISHQHHCRGSF